MTPIIGTIASSMKGASSTWTYWYPGTTTPLMMSNNGKSNLALSGSNLVSAYYWNTKAAISAVSTSGIESWTFQCDNTEPFFSAGICSDSSGNLYAVGYYNVTGTSFQYVIKTNSSGVLQWQVARGRPTGSGVEPVAINTDGSFVYVTGYDVGSGNTNGDGFVTTWACSNGAFQQHRTIRNPGSPLSTFLGQSRIYSGSLYVIPSAGYSIPPTRGQAIQLQQFTTGATPSYVSTYQIDNPTGGTEFNNRTFAIDGSGNFYFVGNSFGQIVSGRDAVVIVKTPIGLNTINFARAYGSTLGEFNQNSTSFFANNFLYIQTALVFLSDGLPRMCLLKVNPSNGDVVWARAFTTGRNHNVTSSMYVDATNVFALNRSDNLLGGVLNTPGIYKVLETGAGAGGTYSYGGATWTYSDITSTISTINVSFTISNPTFSTSTSTGLNTVGSPSFTFNTSIAGSYAQRAF